MSGGQRPGAAGAEERGVKSQTRSAARQPGGSNAQGDSLKVKLQQNERRRDSLHARQG